MNSCGSGAAHYEQWQEHGQSSWLMCACLEQRRSKTAGKTPRSHRRDVFSSLFAWEYWRIFMEEISSPCLRETSRSPLLAATVCIHLEDATLRDIRSLRSRINMAFFPNLVRYYMIPILINVHIRIQINCDNTYDEPTSSNVADDQIKRFVAIPPSDPTSRSLPCRPLWHTASG